MKVTTPLTRILPLALLLLILIPSATLVSPLQQGSPLLSDEEPLSIILMIGDGMGYEHVKLAQLVEVGDYGSLTMQQLTWNTSVTTHSANQAITDSAAAGTAIATGFKTDNGMIGILPNGTSIQNIVEYSQTLGKATGVISTCRIVDATPASFSTHVDDRNDRTEIARQIVENASIDVLLGGGTDYFSPAQITTIESNGYSVVYNRSSMLSVSSGKIFGLFGEVHMDYEIYRNYTLTPSIAEMTNKSIELLSQDPDGFFLMVEGGLIDLAAHDENKINDVLETIAFDEAVQIALDYVQGHSNTILMVTADHETEGLVVVSYDLSGELPSDLTTQNEKEALRIERVNNVTVEWTASYHTNTPVPLYCYGSVFSGLPQDIAIDNTAIIDLMKDFYLGNPLSVTPVSTPTPTVSTTTTTTPTPTPISTIPDVVLIGVGIGVIALVVIVVVVIKRR